MADASVRRKYFSPNLIAGLVLTLLVTLVLGWQQPWNSSTPVTRPAIGAGAAESIARQVGALDSATTFKEFQRAAGSTAAARAWAKQTYDNLDALAVTELRLRFVGGGEPRLRADGATEATVDASWRAGTRSGLAQDTPSTATMRLILDPTGDDRFAVRGAAADDGPLPLWLVGALDVRTSAGTTLISVDDGDTRQPIDAYVTRARATVQAVIGSATSMLVVISPHTQAQTAEILNQPEAQLAQIAAVTTALDGTARPKSAVAIVLNPAVFATMDERAAQIVMAHEATHVMTGATLATMDTWVSEGFADYVALRADKAPLRVSAGQILAQVKASGAPAQLPTAADFEATRHGLGSVYESAWLAFRMLAADYGDTAVLAFYNDARAGTSTEKAAHSAFGLSLKTLTAKWRAYLTKSASMAL